MKKNFYTVKKEINGKEYTAQFSGLSCALKAVDSTYLEDKNVTSTEKMAEYLFKNIIVEPAGLTVDDFDNIDEFNEVVKFAREVMQGKFREEIKQEADKAKN